MSTGKKVLIGVGGVLFLLMLIGIFSDPQKESSTASDVKTTTPENKSTAWTTVCTIKGNGTKKSAIFELSGNEARIVYKYKSNAGTAGMGTFAVYVVNQGEQILKDGGFPEVMIDKDSESGESALHKDAGKYYLDINAMGDWEVVIEENK